MSAYARGQTEYNLAKNAARSSSKALHSNNVVNNGIARITGMPRLVLILRILSRLDHAPRAADASRSTLVSRSGGVVVYTRQVRIRAI